MFRVHRLLALLTVVPVALMAAPAQAPRLDGRFFFRTAATVTTTAARTTEARSTAAVAGRTLVQLDGVTVSVPTGGRQVVTVKHTHDMYARITLWQRQAGTWQILARSIGARIGADGLVQPWNRIQDSDTTPLGTYRLLWAFGSHPHPTKWRLDYRQIKAGDYWVEDNASAYYNRYRNRAEGGFRWWLPMDAPNSSELLRHYPVQYEYSIVIGFNYNRPVRHRGAGIFLHVNGPGPTAGCVSAPRWFLQKSMATLDPALQPVIAIGR